MVCAASLLLFGTLVMGARPVLALEQAVDRFAFVIGNAYYSTNADGQPKGFSPFNLETPLNDALRYESTLDTLGWTILNQAIHNRTSSNIRNDLETALNRVTPGSEVVFVFTGHGFSNETDNYIVGIPEFGTSFSSTGEMIANSIHLRDIVGRIASRQPKRIILIINACGDVPLLEATRAPTRMSFPELSAELLILYSSSPRGIAYDYIGNEAFAEDTAPMLSLFTRAFIPQIEKDQPLLTAFAQARIEVERLSVQAALSRQVPELIGRQIPHVAYDTLNGRFNLRNVRDTFQEAASIADWRIDPQSCRLNAENLAEALSLRSTAAEGPEGAPVRACVLAGALNDLGIEKMTYSSEEGGVVVEAAASDGFFNRGDTIQRIAINRPGASRQTVVYTSIEDFQRSLQENYFIEGTVLTFLWTSKLPQSGGSGFRTKTF